MKEFVIGALLATLICTHFDEIYANIVVFFSSF